MKNLGTCDDHGVGPRKLRGIGNAKTYMGGRWKHYTSSSVTIELQIGEDRLGTKMQIHDQTTWNTLPSRGLMTKAHGLSERGLAGETTFTYIFECGQAAQ